MEIIYVLAIIFWAQGKPPVVEAPPYLGRAEMFHTPEACAERGKELDQLWVKGHRRGNTSWACLAAVRVEQESGV